MKTAFTKHERERIAAVLHLNGTPRNKIARTLGVSKECVRNYLKKAQLINEKTDITQRDQEILSALACGWTWEEITEFLPCGMSTIASALQKQQPQKFFYMPTPNQINSRKQEYLSNDVERKQAVAYRSDE